LRISGAKTKQLGTSLFRGNRLAGLREKRYECRIESAPNGVNEARNDRLVPQLNFPAHADFNPVPPLRTLFSDGAIWIVSMTRRFSHVLETRGIASAEGGVCGRIFGALVANNRTILFSSTHTEVSH
jgi:hypothetical protein